MTDTTEPTTDQVATPSFRPSQKFQPDEPTAEERDAVLKDFAGKLNTARDERRAAVAAAEPALQRLCGVMRQMTDQSGHVRGLLYSMFNGQPYSLLEIVAVDWAVQKDICAVLLAFGYEDRETKFFYDSIKTAVVSAGLWDWFIAAESGVAA